jgi:hypothetical protein
MAGKARAGLAVMSRQCGGRCALSGRQVRRYGRHEGWVAPCR